VTAPGSTGSTVDRIRLGTAPDSWGVWFADDPAQIPWPRFLDDVVEAGYEWIELGPYGYLPTEADRLRDELGRRGLRASGQAVFAALHRGAAAWDEALSDALAVARLVRAVGARHLVYLPSLYRTDDGTGGVVEPAELTPQQWSALTGGVTRLGRILAEEHGVRLAFHPHADTHVGTQRQVERFLQDTDPQWVSLCLDTGHISYYGGDNLELIRRYPERIGYVHLKQVDPAVTRRVAEDGISMAEAVRAGVMVEPPTGVPDLEPVIAALAGLDTDLFAIVEQDLYPCAFDVPLPIAARTRDYLRRCGLGAGRPVAGGDGT
jgi:inosose dehydratase